MPKEGMQGAILYWSGQAKWFLEAKQNKEYSPKLFQMLRMSSSIVS